MARSVIHFLLLILLILGVHGRASFAEEPTSAGSPIGPFTEHDWPWWRGAHRDGVASPNQNPPVSWSATKNIQWKVPIPGKGHGSMTIVGNRIYLATSRDDEEKRSVLCLDRERGETVWETVVHHGSPTPPKNKKGTQASSTIACDGRRLFINFLHDGAMYTSALDLAGELLWQTKISDYVVHQGYGSSPAIYQGLVIVSADNKSGGAVAALDRASGDIVWKRDRPKVPNYSSPVIHEVAGKTQLIMTGCDLVTGLNPLTGEQLWEIAGATTECVTTTPTDGRHIYTSGGYPRNHVAAIRADGSGEIAWENGTRVYVPSMLIRNSYLYAVADGGFAVCWNSETGEEMWKGRLGGTFSASPVLVGDRIYVTNEEGETFLFTATPERFELLSKNTISGECLSTMVISQSCIYLRMAHEEDGRRQEYLYCIRDR